MRLISVSKPWITKLEKKYVRDCLDSGFISFHSKYHQLLEEQLAEYVGSKYVSLMANGSVACYVLCKILEVEGTYIICPNLTYVATPNAIVHSGNIPLFIDCDKDTWNIDKQLLNKINTEDFCDLEVSSLFYVDLFGNPNDIISLKNFCDKNKLELLGDCCESFGGSNTEKKVGGVGSCAFSGYANKSITFGGEGGFISTDNQDVYEYAELIKGQYHEEEIYNHIGIGWNFRLTGIQAAFGLAQLHRIDDIQNEKERVYNEYIKCLGGYVKTQKVEPSNKHSNWVFACLLPNQKTKVEVHNKLKENGIETRPFFKPMTLLKPYLHCKLITKSEFPFSSVSQQLYDSGIILPSYCELKNSQIKYISNIIKGCCDV